MSFIYCEVCKKNFSKSKYFQHKDKINNDTLIIYFPQDIVNIISTYKYQIEIYEKYKKFTKFLDFFDSIKTYETLSITYNCYKVHHYIDDIVYIMQNHYKDLDFEYVIRHMISGRKLKNLKINRKIFKLKIEYNIYNKKFYIRYL